VARSHANHDAGQRPGTEAKAMYIGGGAVALILIILLLILIF